MYRLDKDLRLYNNQADKLFDLQSNLGSIPPSYRKLIAEITLLRISDLLQNSFESISCKVACGATYLDGTNPMLIHRCSSMANAISQMKILNRQKPKPLLRWSKVSDMNRNSQHIIDRHDNVTIVLTNHGGLIDEIRRVRNRVAHNNRRSRLEFQIVVARHYGAQLNHITPGSMLLSPRFNPSLLDQLILKTKILIKALVKG